MEASSPRRQYVALHRILQARQHPLTKPLLNHMSPLSYGNRRWRHVFRGCGNSSNMNRRYAKYPYACSNASPRNISVRTPFDGYSIRPGSMQLRGEYSILRDLLKERGGTRYRSSSIASRCWKKRRTVNGSSPRYGMMGRMMWEGCSRSAYMMFSATTVFVW
jgi:hypothetical protein